LGDNLSVEVSHEALISCNIQRNRTIAVNVEQGLKGDGPPDGSRVTLIVPDPKGVIAKKAVLIDIVKIG
jgi:hypothetical protein